MKNKEAAAAMFTRLSSEREKNSTAERYAMSAKAVEVIIRDAVYKHMASADYRARTANKADLRLYNRRAEIKCGGTVIYNIPADGWTENDILAGNTYIVFPVITRIFDEIDAVDNSAIMTRDQFLAYCAQASRKGLRGTFHVTGGKNRPAVVAFQPAPLERLRAMIYNAIITGELQTVGDYILERE